MGTYTVYCHELRQDGRKYFGITSRPVEKRWQKNGTGYKRSCQYFRRAIDEYGWDAFEHTIIAEGLEEQEAKQMEIDLIAKYDTMDKTKGFNLTKGGDGALGYYPSAETRAKMSASQKARPHKKGIPSHNKGKPMSEEQKEKLRQAHLGKTPWNKGIPHSEETKAKMSAKLKGKKAWNKGEHLSEEHKAKLRGIKRSDETRQKLSQSMQGRTPWNKGMVGINPTKTARKVICVETGKVYNSIGEASFDTGANRSAISLTCNGRQHTSGGYHWEYYTQEELDYAV